ncbi:ABC transporter substrate-binding protein [Nocardiopsis sediminis]|uniref:ABC transporter substrate-binding protein n=1 Tax=Nocardiopsis sediminis TaxID=1778267 RepID=A0ABV8FUY5_9ACTN
MTPTSRRPAAAALGLALALAAAAGCAPDDSAGGSTDASGHTTLNWMMWSGGTAERDAWQRAADAVTEARPDITVNLETTSFDDYFTKIGTRMAAESAPCIVSAQSLRLGAIQEGMRPIDDLIEARGTDLGGFEPAALEGLAADGRQYALPYDSGPLIMLYNKDRFAEAGVPEPEPGWTIDDFEAAAHELTAGDDHGVSAFPSDTQMFPLVLTYSGAQPVTPDRTLALDSAPIVDGVTWYTELVHDQQVAPPLAGNDSLFPVNQFVAGNTAMVVDGPWDILNVSSQTDFELGMVPLPAGPDGSRTLSAGSGFGVSRSCPVPEQAYAAIEILTGQDVLTDLAASGRAFPARTAAQQAWLDNAPAGAGAALSAASATAEPLRTTANWTQVTTDLIQYGVPAFNGATPAADILRQVQSEHARG